MSAKDGILNVALGAQMAAARRWRGLTQVHVARRMGIKSQTISMWEAGTVTVSVVRLVNYCDVIGASPIALLEAALPGETAVWLEQKEKRLEKSLHDVREQLRVLRSPP